MIRLANRKIKIVFALLLTALCILCCYLAVSKTNQSNALNYDIPNTLVLDEYCCNDSVEFPSEINIDIGGVTYTAKNGYIIFPNKTITNVGLVDLTQVGKYTIKYFAKKGNDTIIVSKTFYVSNKLYYLKSDNGSITPVTAESQASKTYTSNDDNVLITKQDGLIVRLGEGNTFYYSKSIDLNDVDDEGLCNIISLDYKMTNFVPNPQYTTGSEAFKQYAPNGESAQYCNIRLTDSYDSTNYIEFCCFFDGWMADGKTGTSFDINEAAWYDSYRAIFTARASGQVRTGGNLWNSYSSEWGGFKKVNIGGTDYGIYIDNRFGCLCSDSIALSAQHQPYTWKYDNSTNCVYVEAGSSRFLVTDLSSSVLYGTKAFNGFTSGKVKLSIYMSDYITDNEARIDITNIAKDNALSLISAYEKSGYIDNVATPKIDIGIAETDSNGIYLPIGYEYTLPKAVVTGGFGSSIYDVNVYVNYNQQNQVEVPINNGKIIIDSNLIYTVKYSAYNKDGGESVKLLNINAVNLGDSKEPISVDIDFNGFVLKSGIESVLPNFDIQTTNDSRAIDVKIEAECKDEKIIIDNKTLKFTPLYAEQYKIKFIISDNVCSITKEFNVNCSASGKTKIIDSIVLPKYFIKNAKYSLNEVSAYLFDNVTPTKVDCTCSVSYDNGLTYQVVNNTNECVITGSSTVMFKYSTADDEITSDVLPIIDVNYGSNLNWKNYFIHDDFSSNDYVQELGNNELKYTVNKSSGNACLSFINAVDWSNLSIAFKTLVNQCDYDSLKVILTDYIDENVKYYIALKDDSTWCSVSINGATFIRSSSKFEEDISTKKITYKSETSTLSVNKSVDCVVDFSSIFNSNLCYVEIELNGIKSTNASVVIDLINNQSFRINNNNDNKGPVISFEDFSGSYEINSIVKSSIACVTDILSPVKNDEIKLSIKDSDGNYVSDVNGLEINGVSALTSYSIKVEKYGIYTVEYYAKDGVGKKTSILSSFRVIDTVAPTIEFAESIKETYKVGESVTINLNVNDNLSSKENLNVQVFIMDINTNAFYTFDDLIVKFNIAGQFKIYGYVQDEEGNYSYVTTVVEVS